MKGLESLVLVVGKRPLDRLEGDEEISRSAKRSRLLVQRWGRGRVRKRRGSG
jgi:hypothetical protein